ncbi:hypothetical protein [Comamonas thiooxydans]|uniref:hypothetical protein n=1 Tax=Comamonas thiooxydans TaxID=363952 RepID=UPI000AAB465C|nr:hypothetical protein [Comamonas thiooxydans]
MATKKPSSMVAELSPPRDVPFDRIFLDPNNPRIAPKNPPGYDNLDALFEPSLQDGLEESVRNVYEVSKLEDSIKAQGWVPIDAVIVWEHPNKPDYYVVVEGNTRVVALRSLRKRLDTEVKKLEKQRKSPQPFEDVVREQESVVKRLQDIKAQTDNLRVFPVGATSIAELEQTLPRLLGVRHVTHAQDWKPYPTNLYILSLYERMFREKHGQKKELALEDPLIRAVGDIFSLSAPQTRRSIQAASAFTHFKARYEDQLPEGEKFLDSDHYFFTEILDHPYARDKFGFSKDKLKLENEFAEALFKWAFSKPRNAKNGDDDIEEPKNQNVFYKAESIRAWANIAKYDNKKKTTFAAQLDPEKPDQAPSLRSVEFEVSQHREQTSPIDALTLVSKALKEIKAETLISQEDHLKPILQEISAQVKLYLAMISATHTSS